MAKVEIYTTHVLRLLRPGPSLLEKKGVRFRKWT